MLTQCVEVGLLLDASSEPPMLLSEIFAAEISFFGQTSGAMLGQLFAEDIIGEHSILCCRECGAPHSFIIANVGGSSAVLLDKVLVTTISFRYAGPDPVGL
jgi:hypothetical protein